MALFIHSMQIERISITLVLKSFEANIDIGLMYMEMYDISRI